MQQNIWQLQEAKSKFSELIDKTLVEWRPICHPAREKSSRCDAHR